MESALVTLILVTVVLFGVLTISDTYFSTQDALLIATQAMEERNEERARTELTLIGAETDSSGAIVEVILKNDGTTKVADFDRWDVVVQYYTAQGTYVTMWLPYVETAVPGNNQWSVAGVYLAASGSVPEVYEPGILNPEEEIVIRAKVLPIVGPNTTNLMTIAMANGISQSIIFIR